MLQTELISEELKLEKYRADARERMRVRRAADPEGERERILAWKKANPDKVKTHNRDAKRKYLSVDENKQKRKESAERWRAENPDKIREGKRRCYVANPEKYKSQSKRSALKRNYGLTLEQRDELFAEQGSCCAICKSTEPGSTKGWHIDHCHSTKRVRGILCNHCNLMLGYAKDNKAALASAIVYLSKVEQDDANDKTSA